MATSVLKKITAEAKGIRKKNPKLKWTEAIKKASAFYKGTVKPAAKKSYKVAKAVTKASAKGIAVAKKSYKSSLAGINSQNKKDIKATNIGKFYRVSSDFVDSFKIGGNQKLQKVLGKDLYYQKGIGKNKSWWFNNPKIVSMSNAQLDKLTEKIKSLKEPKPTKKIKIGAVKKIALKRTGAGSSKLGALKKVKTNQIKPVKPTFAILNKQNPAFLSSLVDNSRKPKGKILVYSPFLNRYIIIVKYVDMYTIYIVRPSQTIIFEEVYKVIGTHKNTLARINKTYDIDLIP
jgi:hypothetical protein